jgi:hypothetical protein
VKFFNLVFILPVVVALGVLAGPATTQSTVSVEYNTNRPGADYLQFELSGDNPAGCSNACAADLRCRAFTYVARGVQGPNARCWLTSAAPPAQSHGCCISGVKTTGPVAPSTVTTETNTNRPGSDYRQFELFTDDPGICRHACASEAQCRAFTYVVRGVQGPNPRCWLKSAVPPAETHSCCVSGVKAGAAPPAPPPPPPSTGMGLTGQWRGPLGVYEFVEYANRTFTWTVGNPPSELGKGVINPDGSLTATWGPYPSGVGGGPDTGTVKSEGGRPTEIFWIKSGIPFARVP